MPLHINNAAIYVIAGGSSAGKSTLIMRLQNLNPAPNIRLGIDQIHLSIPSDKLNLSDQNKDYLIGKPHTKDGVPYFSIEHGPIIQMIDRARFQNVCNFVDQGISVFCDEVIWNLDERCEMLKGYLGYKVYMIGVRIDPELAEQRAKGRSNSKENYENNFRPQGMHRASAEATHQFTEYDIDIDATGLSREDFAKQVWQEIQALSEPTAFKTMCDRYLTTQDSN